MYLLIKVDNQVETGHNQFIQLTLTLNVYNFFICKQKPPNLVTFPKIYLQTIWSDMAMFSKSDVATGNRILKGSFLKIFNFKV